MVLELTLLILVWLVGLTAVHRVVPAPPRRPQRAQRPGCCSGGSSLSAGALGHLALEGPLTR
jgi:hypothetical protein